MNTEFITKTVKRHKASAKGAAAGGSLMFILVYGYEVFATKDNLRDHCHDCQVAHSEHWQKIMDHELEIDRAKRKQ